jgi:hypothetical protein
VKHRRRQNGQRNAAFAKTGSGQTERKQEDYSHNTKLAAAVGMAFDSIDSHSHVCPGGAA